MNVAIVIGVCNYKNAPDLSACFNDAQIINSIIQATNKYDDILFLDGQEINSYDVKSSIIEFIKTHKEQPVQELFFYFSGHGKADEGDFYYITTDTSIEHINSTSLQNSELDTLLRELNPQLFVKIVDACNSGVSYIKGNSLAPDDANSLLEKSIKQKDFNKCYFMSSSQFDQNSYASMKMSDFTNSFISCIINSPASNVIRYKHIVDAVSDYFENNKKQKPFFVLQADMTEEFCISTDELINLSKGIVYDEPVRSNTKTDEELSLEQKVLKAIVKCATLKETQEVSQQLTELVKAYTCTNKNIDEYFNLTIKELNPSSVPMAKGIGEWVNKNQVPFRLFAEPRYKKEEVENSIVGYVQTRNKLVGYIDTTQNLEPGNVIVIHPKNLGLPLFSLVIAYIYSSDKIYIISNYVASYPTDWGQYEESAQAGWKYFDIETKSFSSAHKDKLRNVLQGFEAYILTTLNKYLN